MIYPEAFKRKPATQPSCSTTTIPHSLAKAIVKVGSTEERSRLAMAGQQRLAYFAEQIDEGHRQLARHLMRLRYRRYPQIY